MMNQFIDRIDHIQTYIQKEETALMLASRKGSSDIVKLLVDNGADFMAKNKVYTWLNYIMLVCVLNLKNFNLFKLYAI
jgi:ankyrin repeat protein